jgi:hypothetical protein|uniref:Uncharacterized protein n=1 Tax=Zea mays TaxID=4577 RepID=C0P5W0_MAIZE|nr:unknown [Zea mays]
MRRDAVHGGPSPMARSSEAPKLYGNTSASIGPPRASSHHGTLHRAPRYFLVSPDALTMEDRRRGAAPRAGKAAAGVCRQGCAQGVVILAIWRDPRLRVGFIHCHERIPS